MKKLFTFAALAALTVCSCIDHDFETDEPAAKPDAPVVTGVVLNEICTSEKYIELYNTGSTEVSLAGMTLVKYDSSKEGGKSVTWTGAEGLQLAAKSYICLESSDLADPVEDGNPDYQYQSENHIFNGGLSGKKNLKIELRASDDSVLDTFVRGEEGAGWNQVKGYANNKTNSFSRVPDGTGEWAYAAPTKGTANGEKTGEIEMLPDA